MNMKELKGARGKARKALKDAKTRGNPEEIAAAEQAVTAAENAVNERQAEIDGKKTGASASTDAGNSGGTGNTTGGEGGETPTTGANDPPTATTTQAPAATTTQAPADNGEAGKNSGVCRWRVKRNGVVHEAGDTIDDLTDQEVIDLARAVDCG